MNNEISKTEPRLAWRYWSKAKPRFYVAQLPGRNGADWGYTDKIQGKQWGSETLDAAIPLSPYWQRRFRADCERVGATARFMPAPTTLLSPNLETV
jgi:hypothetical protein